MFATPNGLNPTFERVNSTGGYYVDDTQVIDGNGKLIESATISIADGDEFLDTSGNEMLAFGVTASAVNEFKISNAATGNGPTLASQGETNVDMNFSPAGTGVIRTNAKIALDLNGGADSASGLLMGVGTTASPAASSTAGDNFAEFRTRSSATSGDNRGLYWRHEFTGAGGGGEAIRAFSKVSAAVATARGAHISLDVNTTGSVTGLGVGVDAQILVPDQALGGGTYGVVNSEIYSAGSSSSVAASDIAFFRAVAGGDATGAGTVDSGAYLFSIQGLTAGASNLFRTGLTAVTVNAATTAALKIKVGSTDYFIPLATATA